MLAERTREEITVAKIGVEAPGWQGARRARTRRYATDDRARKARSAARGRIARSRATEQRRQPGCIGAEVATLISERVQS